MDQQRSSGREKVGKGNRLVYIRIRLQELKQERERLTIERGRLRGSA